MGLCVVSFLGSILEGPDPANLKPLVEQAMPMLIELLKDPSVAVRDTTGNGHSFHESGSYSYILSCQQRRRN